jgi:hypothetical protein
MGQDAVHVMMGIHKARHYGLTLGRYHNGVRIGRPQLGVRTQRLATRPSSTATPQLGQGAGLRPSTSQSGNSSVTAIRISPDAEPPSASS